MLLKHGVVVCIKSTGLEHAPPQRRGAAKQACLWIEQAPFFLVSLFLPLSLTRKAVVAEVKPLQLGERP